MSTQTTHRPDIQIVAALITDPVGRVLLVRKHGTECFMQPGGKIEPGEAPLATLAREVLEEIGCTLAPGSECYLGTFVADAANETGHKIAAQLYAVEITGVPRPMAEIDELIWLSSGDQDHFKLAPFTRDTVLPLASEI